jgi:hypothetical protein
LTNGGGGGGSMLMVVAAAVLATWLGNPFGIPRNSAINPILDLLNYGIFIGILFFRS